MSPPGGVASTALATRASAVVLFAATACAPAAVTPATLAPADAEQAREDEALRAVRSRAMGDLGCPPEGLRVARLPSRERLYLAEGCGRRGVLLEQRTAGPVGAGRVERVVRYTNVSAPAQASAPFDAEAARWRDLVVHGARDLACPEERITPDIVWDRVDFHRAWAPRFPVAEGCGKRAIYDRHAGMQLCDPTILSVEP
jgi:hypothetical protein